LLPEVLKVRTQTVIRDYEW